MCTLEKRGRVFILKLTGDGDEHRLSPAVIDEINSTVRRVRSDPSASRSVLVTTAEGKFFSNGYDFSAGRSDLSLLHLMHAKLRALFANLITLPLPTIAAVTGHASAAAFCLVMCHDYVLMRRDRGFLYMTELDLDLEIPAWAMSLIRLKIGSPAARRAVVMTSAKLTAVEAAEKGIVGGAYDGAAGAGGGIVDGANDGAAETVEAAVRLGEDLVSRGFDGHVYGRMREILLKEVLDEIVSCDTSSACVRNNASRL
ncbi:PREDICTED: enoyl-CoA delta isomerase 1, peroxisomal-like [Tarenaya hassleriana]|uniref:enoyl-CoA delta isomerase 1, peroxisomal-like n=1 Tax=Tarenaya hassleriana TaxID=28532 RepID=UPI00053C1540|nr:PREDICTED: enoyl-CoA delta isomerase 1, peroxisomal-like [Tarenaya hassleriana]